MVMNDHEARDRSASDHPGDDTDFDIADSFEEAMRALEADMSTSAPLAHNTGSRTFPLGRPGEGRALHHRRGRSGRRPRQATPVDHGVLGPALLLENAGRTTTTSQRPSRARTAVTSSKSWPGFGSRGIRVFYDRDEQARLWGRNLLDELTQPYRNRAFRTLIFVASRGLSI